MCVYTWDAIPQIVEIKVEREKFDKTQTTGKGRLI